MWGERGDMRVGTSGQPEKDWVVASPEDAARNADHAVFRILWAATCLWALTACPCAQGSEEGQNFMGRVVEFQGEAAAMLLVNETALREAVEHVAGPDRSIILASSGTGFLNLLENWAASVQAQGYESRILFVANDHSAYQYLASKWPNQVFLDTWLDTNPENTRSLQGFGTGFFRNVCNRRPALVLQILKFNVTVFMNDADMVWAADPYPFFDQSHDVTIQEDTKTFRDVLTRFPHGAVGTPYPQDGPDVRLHNPCGCLVYVRPTQGAEVFMRHWIAEMKGLRVVDQDALKLAVPLALREGVSVGVVPPSHFPSGCLFFGSPNNKFCQEGHAEFKAAVSEYKAWPVIVHANWMYTRYKMKSLKKKNLWFLPSN